jgi:mono/diheme cytochrome c family protein
VWTKLGLATAGLALAVVPWSYLSGGAVAANADSAAAVQKGRQLFNDYACGTCHVLGDAGGDGHVGPSLDGDGGLTKALVIDRVTNGQGPMPGFGGQMSDAEIATLAEYVVTASKK